MKSHPKCFLAITFWYIAGSVASILSNIWYWWIVMMYCSVSQPIDRDKIQSHHHFRALRAEASLLSYNEIEWYSVPRVTVYRIFRRKWVFYSWLPIAKVFVDYDWANPRRPGTHRRIRGSPRIPVSWPCRSCDTDDSVRVYAMVYSHDNQLR